MAASQTDVLRATTGDGTLNSTVSSETGSCVVHKAAGSSSEESTPVPVRDDPNLAGPVNATRRSPAGSDAGLPKNTSLHNMSLVQNSPARMLNDQGGSSGSSSVVGGSVPAQAPPTLSQLTKRRRTQTMVVMSSNFCSGLDATQKRVVTPSANRSISSVHHPSQVSQLPLSNTIGYQSPLLPPPSSPDVPIPLPEASDLRCGTKFSVGSISFQMCWKRRHYQIIHALLVVVTLFSVTASQRFVSVSTDIVREVTSPQVEDSLQLLLATSLQIEAEKSNLHSSIALLHSSSNDQRIADLRPDFVGITLEQRRQHLKNEVDAARAAERGLHDLVRSFVTDVLLCAPSKCSAMERDILTRLTDESRRRWEQIRDMQTSHSREMRRESSEPLRSLVEGQTVVGSRSSVEAETDVSSETVSDIQAISAESENLDLATGRSEISQEKVPLIYKTGGVIAIIVLCSAIFRQ